MQFSDQLFQYLLTGLTNGAIYALLAVGFVAIYTVTGVINFAQGESAMLGALAMVTLHLRMGLPLWLAFLLSVTFAAIVGALLYLLALRPRRSASPVTLIIITIGASIAIRGTALLVWGTNSYPLPAFSKVGSINLSGAVIRTQSLWVLGVTLAAVAGLYFFFRFTLLGKAVRACAVNPLAASLMGIDKDRISAVSFALGSALGAVAGAVIAPITYATYDMGAMLGLKGFVAAILGGLSSTPGALAGGFLLGVLETTGAGLISSGAKDAIAFAVLMVCLFLRPAGLFAALRTARQGA